jgi:hypothetical protein
MNQAADMDGGEFHRRARAVESRLRNAELLQKEIPTGQKQPEQLTVDYAHVTDSTNFMLALLEFPPELHAFIDALVGIGGYRTASPEWFRATDKTIARRVNRCEKWVQLKRKELIDWQTKHNTALVDIEDNDYRDGEKVPHKYRVNIARLSAESTLDARVSPNWSRGRFDEALEQSAATVLDSLPEVPTHKKHRRIRPDALTSMMRDLKFAHTKTKKAKQTNELTGNQLDLTSEMVGVIGGIRRTLDAIEGARPR